MRVSLFKLRIRVPEELKIWSSCPEELCAGLLSANGGALSNIIIPWSIYSGGKVEDGPVSPAAVKFFCQVVETFMQMFPWAVGQQYPGNFDDNEEEEDSEEGDDWIKDEDFPHNGEKVRFEVWDKYWADGEITGYIPISEEDPTALWQATAEVIGKQRNIDLDEEEVTHAMHRFRIQDR